MDKSLTPVTSTGKYSDVPSKVDTNLEVTVYTCVYVPKVLTTCMYLMAGNGLQVITIANFMVLYHHQHSKGVW